MEMSYGQPMSANSQDLFQPNEVIKDGFLEKRSKFIKAWRNRYVVLTKTHLLTHKKKNRSWTEITELIPLKNCKVQSADDELKI